LIAALALGAVVLFGRMYVGAHLPLDIIGGAALGAIAGSVVNLIVHPWTAPRWPRVGVVWTNT
jgi:undecaprenyl-diphosphatase